MVENLCEKGGGDVSVKSLCADALKRWSATFCEFLMHSPHYLHRLLLVHPYLPLHRDHDYHDHDLHHDHHHSPHYYQLEHRNHHNQGQNQGQGLIHD